MRKYNRNYWRPWLTSITARDRSDLAEFVTTNGFRSVFRYFLFKNFLQNDSFQTEATIMRTEDSSYYDTYSEEVEAHGTNDILDDVFNYEASFPVLMRINKALKLEKSYTTKITEIEKEFFYLRCLKLQITPQIILRIFLRLSKVIYQYEAWNDYNSPYLTDKYPDLYYFLSRINLNISGHEPEPVEGNAHGMDQPQEGEAEEILLPEPTLQGLEALSQQKEVKNTSQLFVMEEKSTCKACGNIYNTDQSACPTCIKFAQFILEN